MAPGRRKGRRAGLVAGRAGLPRPPGHASHDRPRAVRIAAGSERFAEGAGAPRHATRRGRPSPPPGRSSRTRLVGSVAYFPEKYGTEILKVALDILHRRAVPPAVFVKHQMVTPDNVNHIYPNDELMLAN